MSARPARRRFLRLAAVLGLAVIAGPAWGAGFETQEMGAKALGMANAFTGQADDASAVFYNPAGIARLKGIQLYGGTTWIDPKGFYSTDERTDALGRTNENQRTNGAAIFIPHGFGTFSMDLSDTLRLGFGGGIGVPFGLSIDYGKSEGFSGRFNVQNAEIQVIEGMFNAALEADVTDSISIAGSAGISLIYAALTLERAIDLPAATAGTALAGTPEGSVRLELDTNEDSLEWRWNIAGMVRLLRDGDYENGRVRVGFVFRDGVHSISAKGRARTANRVDPTAAGALGLAGSPNRASLETRLPGNLRVGVSVDVTKDLTINFDWRWTNWSVMKTFQLRADQPGLNGTPLVFEYRDSNYYAIGGEYRIMNWDDDELGIAVRFGGLYDQSPVPRSDVQPLLPDNDRWGLTAGFGFQPTESMTIDIAYMGLYFERFRNKNQSSNAATHGLGKYKSWANLFSISFGLKF